MRSILFATFLTSARSSLPWPFSWDTLPTLAFPGAANRMMTEAEVEYFTANFSSINIWGLNATCINVTTGATFPADCPHAGSRCLCDVPEPRSVNQRFVQSMESSLRAQAVALKAAAARRGKFFPVLGYIESGAMDQYSSAQALAMYDPAYVSFMLSLKSVGLVDCFRDRCDYQGIEFRQFDLRLPEVRAYVAAQVLGQLVNDSALDGSFIDTLEMQYADLCHTVGCTPEEVSSIQAGSLLYLSAMLDAGAAAGKVIASSCHITPSQDRLYYGNWIAALAAHSNSSLRFWEYFTGDPEQLGMLMSEVALGLAQQVHAQDRTLNPDWVELAAFLIGAGDHSYFSCSGPWNLDSFPVFPEFQKPLGKPLGAAVLSNGSATPQAPWAMLPSVNLVAGLVQSPTWSQPGVVGYAGKFDTAPACLAAVRANASYVAMAYIGEGGGEWALGCWGRLDARDWPGCINAPSMKNGCYSYEGQAFAVGAVSVAFNRTSQSVWTRSFEFLDVTYSPGTGGATLAWK